MSVNTIKTAALLALLSAVLIVAGALAGSNGMYFSLALAAVMNFSSYFLSDKIAQMSYSAQPVSETRNHVGHALACPRKRDE